MASGRLFLPGWMPALDNDGAPLVSARAFFYLNMTDTLAPIFADEALTVPLSNPVLANIAGRFPAIWASDETTYSYSVDALNGPAGIPFTGDGLNVSQGVEIMVAEAAEAAAADAAAQVVLAQAEVAEAQAYAEQAEQAYEDIIAFAAGSPDAPSVLNKANLNGDNISGANAVSFTNAIAFDDAEADSVPVLLGDFIRDQPVNAAAYGFIPDGADRSAEFGRAILAAIATDRELYIPPGTYRCDTSTRVYLTQQLLYKIAFRKGLRIRGAGSGRTVIDSRVANDFWLYISVGNGMGGENTFASFAGILGGYIQGLTVRNGAPTAASSGICVRAQYQMPMRDLHIVGLSGTGIKTLGGHLVANGDYDSNNQIAFEDVRVEDCLGWGIDAGNDAPFNENSFTTFSRTFVQNCGTADEKAITAIAQDAAGTFTVPNHGFTNGQRVFVGYVGGMTQVNSAVAETGYVVTVLNANQFTIATNTTGFSAYTSGGVVFPSTPSSGGVRLKGQIVSFINCGWTICKNRSVWIDGNGGGLPQDVFFYSSTIENPRLIGLHVQGCRTVMANGLHIYTNGGAAGGPVLWGHLYDAESSIVSSIKMEGMCIRTTSHANEADLTIAQTLGSNALPDSIRWDTQAIDFKQFGANNQRLFRRVFQGDVPQQCRLTVFSTTLAGVRPDPSFPLGRIMPLRVTYGGAGGATFANGPWIESRVPPGGVNKSNAGLAANTNYYAYYFTENSAINLPQLEFSTTAPVLDETGYLVKTGETHKLCCCDETGTPIRVRTDAGSLFITTGGSFLQPTRIGAENVGNSSLTWVNTADRKLYFKTAASLPANAVAGDWSYWPSFETSVAYDPPSLAAGAETTVDVTVVCGASDFCTGVAFSTGFGGLIAVGTVKAANTVTVYIKNPTAGVIDLAAGTIRVAVQRR